jgi:hypothetical protein
MDSFIACGFVLAVGDCDVPVICVALFAPDFCIV